LFATRKKSKVVKLSKRCQKIVKKIVKKLSKVFKTCQNLVEKLVKNLSKSCQKVVKNVKNLSKISANLEKNDKSNGAIVEKVRWCNSNKSSKGPEKMKKKIGGS
jgi:hypothetical protein